MGNNITCTNITCTTYCNRRTAVTLYTLETVCSKYAIVNILYRGEKIVISVTVTVSLIFAHESYKQF